MLQKSTSLNVLHLIYVCLRIKIRSVLHKILSIPFIAFFKGLSQLVPGARTASKNYYLSHIIVYTVLAPGTICESPVI